MTTNNSKGKTLRLNVGGTHFEVLCETLERCEGSMLATLASDHKKDLNSDEVPIFIDADKQSLFLGTDEETIFIDRNGRLFEYVLDYLRTNKVHLPPSVSRAAVKEEFEFYGIDADMTFPSEMYDCNYFLELAEEVTAESNQLAAKKAAEKSAHIMKEEQAIEREVAFFIMLEYYKTNPAPETDILIGIPAEYRRYCSTPWVHDDLSKRGFRVVEGCSSTSSYTVKIRRELKAIEPYTVKIQKELKGSEPLQLVTIERDMFLGDYWG